MGTSRRDFLRSSACALGSMALASSIDTFGIVHALTPQAATDYKALVKVSSKETSTDHPVILSLRPANADAGDSPQLVEPAPEHKSVRVKVPGTAANEEASLVFEIVYQGVGHK